MALGTKYTDMLQVEQQAAAQQLNELGDLVVTPASWADVSPCREEPSSGGTVASGVGAKAITYSSELFMPADCPAVEENALVRVLNTAGEVQVIARVLRFKRYKHYCKIWV